MIKRRLRRLVYAVIRSFEWMTYGYHRMVGSVIPRRWKRAGSCHCCGQCCVTPSLSMPRWISWIPFLLKLVIILQRWVNGFEFIKMSEDRRVAEFHCHHYDPETRLCCDYLNRPVNCRTYPRIETWFSQPRFLNECGFYAVPMNTERISAMMTAEETTQMENFLRERSRSTDPQETLGGEITLNPETDPTKET